MSMSGIFIISGKLKASLYWQIYYFSTTLIALIFGTIYYKNMLTTIILLSIARASAHLIYILLSYKFSKGILPS